MVYVDIDGCLTHSEGLLGAPGKDALLGRDGVTDLAGHLENIGRGLTGFFRRAYVGSRQSRSTGPI